MQPHIRESMRVYGVPDSLPVWWRASIGLARAVLGVEVPEAGARLDAAQLAHRRHPLVEPLEDADDVEVREQSRCAGKHRVVSHVNQRRVEPPR